MNIERKLERDGIFLCIPIEEDDCADYICEMDSSLGKEESRDCAEKIVKCWNGYNWAIKRAQDLAEENEALLATLRGMHFNDENYGFGSDCPMCKLNHKAAIAAAKPTQSTPAPAEPQSQPEPQG